MDAAGRVQLLMALRCTLAVFSLFVDNCLGEEEEEQQLSLQVWGKRRIVLFQKSAALCCCWKSKVGFFGVQRVGKN